ncbi:uncharacterized protein MELLADRAFT_103519 [Melampsora larici-populina 98AG31]|uniref:Uncharacterized protein n=1 Tax=Melampsora larici-populina (strain 98AG31 / pathotype 3-4-7) TaxID=747676 RepID=F4RBL5_MELLP|nr:uncharacterized protein MELLADRAFT_103519 [Melampsora larici-populina 98AG31]EGG10315.1 hypothetical protein MELLADRAFT_103519 [Melampsora larici-populina 98AG31]
MSIDNKTDNSELSPSGGRPMRNDSGASLPYASESSSSDNRSFADVYPSGVAPCYSQGLICIDGDCICHAFNAEREKNLETLRAMRGLISGLPKPVLDVDSDSDEEIVCKAPEDTDINRISGSRLSEGNRINNLESNRTHAVNATNFAQGDSNVFFPSRNSSWNRLRRRHYDCAQMVCNSLRPERFRATLTAQLNALSSRRDQIETSRSEGPVAKP